MTTFTERMRLPHYVYRLYGDDMTLLYVGATYDPRKRLREHRPAPWSRQVATTRVTAYANAAEAYRAERAAHIAERPIHSLNATNPLGLAIEACRAP